MNRTVSTEIFLIGLLTFFAWIVIKFFQPVLSPVINENLILIVSLVMIVAGFFSSLNDTFEFVERLQEQRYRFNVANSRLRKKLIAIASRSVVDLLISDLEIFANAVIWKRLYHHYTPDLLYAGVQNGYSIFVRGLGVQ
jgi:hypothetical protein